MSVVLAALLMLGQTTPNAQPAVPPDVMFLFFKVFALHERTQQLGCSAPEQDVRFAAVRKRLIAYYGPSIFSPKKPSNGTPGDCGVVMVYNLNLIDLERAAGAAMTPKGAN